MGAAFDAGTHVHRGAVNANVPVNALVHPSAVHVDAPVNARVEREGVSALRHVYFWLNANEAINDLLFYGSLAALIISVAFCLPVQTDRWQNLLTVYTMASLAIIFAVYRRLVCQGGRLLQQLEDRVRAITWAYSYILLVFIQILWDEQGNENATILHFDKMQAYTWLKMPDATVKKDGSFWYFEKAVISRVKLAKGNAQYKPITNCHNGDLELGTITVTPVAEQTPKQLKLVKQSSKMGGFPGV
eukprot:950838-Amphidinium_carterae.1